LESEDYVRVKAEEKEQRVMDRLNPVFGKVLLCICEVLVGILLLINPMGFTAAIIKAVGILLMLIGALEIYRYFRLSPEAAFMGQGLAKGLCIVLGGLFCLLRSKWFIVTFPLMTILYGIVILITGIVRIQWTVDMLRMEIEHWYLAAVGAVLSLVFAGVILVNPFGTAAFLWTFVAISLIVDAVADLVVLIIMNPQKSN